MAKTANLAKSKETKNDEFYTQYAAVPQLTSLFNYYSTGDEVLSIYDTPDSDGSGKITIQPFDLGGSTYHSWQKQERFKGRWMQSALGGWAGTSEMGWEFSTQGFWDMGSPPMYTPCYVHGVLAMEHVRTALSAILAPCHELHR